MGGGGGAKDCAHKHITSSKPNSLSAGVQGPGSSRVVLMLFRAIWALFLSILIKNWIKKQLIQFFFDLLRPPLDPPLHKFPISSLENQKGTIAVQSLWQYYTLLALNWRYVTYQWHLIHRCPHYWWRWWSWEFPQCPVCFAVPRRCSSVGIRHPGYQATPVFRGRRHRSV